MDAFIVESVILEYLMVRCLLLSLALSCMVWSSGTAQVVVLGTKEGGRIAGLDFGPGDLVRYDIEYDSASIFVSGSVLDNFAGPINLDALHVSQEGDLFFSIRGVHVINGESFRHTDIVSILKSTNETSRFYRAENDIAGSDLLPNGNLLVSTKVDTVIDGVTFETGSIVEVDPVNNVGSVFFSASNFFTIEEGGVRPKGNIDAINLLPNGNLLLSTSNTAEIGTSVENAVEVLQNGVYEYDSTTGSVTTYLDPSVFQSTSTDLKAFSVLSPISVLLEGDINIDGEINFSDIYPLVILLLDHQYLVQADCNLDGVVNFLDVPLFAAILIASLNSE